MVEDINIACDHAGNTGLHLSIHKCIQQKERKSRMGIVRLLLEKGKADPNVHNKRPGWTPLVQAIVGNHVPIVQLLLKHGADINLVSKKAFLVNECRKEATPLMEAAAASSLQLVQLLLEKGANVTPSNNRGDTALHLASKTGCVHVVQYLLTQQGTDVSTANHQDETPLHLATLSKSSTTVECLLRAGANVHSVTKTNDRGFGKSTALHIACRLGHAGIVQKLLEYGANPEQLDAKGQSPMSLALEKRDDAVLAFLCRMKKKRQPRKLPPPSTMRLL